MIRRRLLLALLVASAMLSAICIAVVCVTPFRFVSYSWGSSAGAEEVKIYGGAFYHRTQTTGASVPAGPKLRTGRVEEEEPWEELGETFHVDLYGNARLRRTGSSSPRFLGMVSFYSRSVSIWGISGWTVLPFLAVYQVWWLTRGRSLPFRRRYRDGRCRQCGYDLRALDGDLCPECGLQFRWPIPAPPRPSFVPAGRSKSD